MLKEEIRLRRTICGENYEYKLARVISDEILSYLSFLHPSASLLKHPHRVHSYDATSDVSVRPSQSFCK